MKIYKNSPRASRKLLNKDLDMVKLAEDQQTSIGLDIPQSGNSSLYSENYSSDDNKQTECFKNLLNEQYLNEYRGSRSSRNERLEERKSSPLPPVNRYFIDLSGISEILEEKEEEEEEEQR